MVEFTIKRFKQLNRRLYDGKQLLLAPHALILNSCSTDGVPLAFLMVLIFLFLKQMLMSTFNLEKILHILCSLPPSPTKNSLWSSFSPYRCDWALLRPSFSSQNSLVKLIWVKLIFSAHLLMTGYILLIDEPLGTLGSHCILFCTFVCSPHSS